MRRLMLLRHAKSDWSVAGAPDHDRTLNARGRAAAARMGQYLVSEKLIPTRILCSTATRTRETCELLTAELPHPPPVDFEQRLYEATPDAIVKLIAATTAGVHALLVIGHNPGMQLAALSLAADSRTKHRTMLTEKYPTAALAVIDFDGESWPAVTAHAGNLERFVTPREIMRAD